MTAVGLVVRVGCALGLGVVLLLAGAAAPASAAAGDVTGTVTGRGTPLANATVTLTPVTEAGSPTGAPSVTLTDSAGRYTFAEVAAARVKIRVGAPAFSGYVDTYHPAQATVAAATTIATAPGQVVADVDLLPAGSISGRVVDLDTGAPVEEARVATWPVDGTGELGIAVPTTEPGGFRVTGLPPIPLEIRVRLPAESRYLDTAYIPGAPTRGVRVNGAGSTGDVVVGVRRGAEISGSVLDDTGAPVPDATVQLSGCQPDCPPAAISDQSGAYRITGIRPGSGLGVRAWRGTDLLEQWFPGQADFTKTAKLTLTGSEVLRDVDFALVRAAFLAVEMRQSRGDGATGVIVRLQTDGTTYHHYFADDETERIGNSAPGAPLLRVGPVPPGSYSMRVTAAAPTPGYLPRRWQTASGPAPAGPIRLTPGQEGRILADLAGMSDPAGRDAGASDLAGTDAGTELRQPGATSSRSGQWPGLASGFLGLGGSSGPFATGTTPLSTPPDAHGAGV